MGFVGYQIFNTENDFDTKTNSINVLLSIPGPGRLDYREKIKHFTQALWAGTVHQDLVDSCASMTPSERLSYYDEFNLKTPQYLDDNGWFPQP